MAKKFQKDSDETTTRGKSSKPRGRRTGNGSKMDNKTGKTSNYWMNIGQLALDATNISTFQAAGTAHPAITANCTPDAVYVPFTPAGIMRVDYMPYFGVVDSPIHPINVAAKRLYDEINSKNSRNPSYDPNDLFIYVVAVANAWSLWSFVRRICGLYPTFSAVNRYWWQPLLETMGIDPISVKKDIVTWRNLCNRIAINLNRLAVPSNIPYFQHVIDQCSQIYADSETEKASLYYFNPTTILRYQYDNDKVGILSAMETPWYCYLAKYESAPVCTPELVEAYFNNMVENLFNDSDINTMAADIIKAYGMENCFNLPMIDETYAISPVYDPIKNLQLNNARVVRSYKDQYTWASYVIHQDLNLNCLVVDSDLLQDHTPDSAIIKSDMQSNHEVPLNFPVDNPGNDLVMLATRYTAYGRDMGVPDLKPAAEACTDIIIDTVAYTFDKDPTTEKWVMMEFKDLNPITPTNLSQQSIDALFKKVEVYSKFACAPLLYVVYPTQKNGVTSYQLPYWVHMLSDVTNYTTVSTQVLKNINEAAIFSIFLPTNAHRTRDESR